MTAKEWLNRGYQLDAEIDQLEAAKRTMLDMLTNTTPNYGGEVVSGTRNPHKYDTYVEYCERIDKRIDELVGIKEEIQEVIALVPNTMQRAVLIGRYLNFKSWEQIAYELNYSYQRVFQVHKKAIQEVSTILNIRVN